MAKPGGDAESSPRLRIWDAPTRVVHWALAVLVPFSWWTAENDMMDRHRLSGIVILGLLLFRLLWGVAGSETARFASFVRGPGTVWRYARGIATRSDSSRPLGHNPLGGWSVLVMIAALLTQVGLGLIAVDSDGIETGPLADYVSFDTGRLAAEIHEIMFYGVVGLIALHILAVAFHHAVLGHNLVAAMITGRGHASRAAREPARAPWWRFIVAAAASALLAWFLSRGLRL